jgi:hypothetical protein
MRGGLGIVLGMVLLAGTLDAQEVQGLKPITQPSVHLGGGLLLAQPTGQFANYVDFGIGVGAHALWEPVPDGALGLRLDGSYLVYGSETRRYSLVPLVDVDVTTQNQIAGLQVGPQLSVGRGRVRAYGFGQIGFSYFATTSSVEGSGNFDSFANTTNFDDFTFASSVGGGFRVQLSQGRAPVALDLGARYLYNGRARYLREGSIEVVGDEVTITPIESQTNLIVYQIGVSIGLGGRRG